MIVGGYLPQYSEEELKEKLSGFSVSHLLKHHAYCNQPLNFESAYLLGAYALCSCNPSLADLLGIDTALAEKQSIAALCALHNQEIYRREGAAEQIAGVAAAVFDYDIQPSVKGFLTPRIESAMDNCGMGGDFYRTPNISTLAALITAADGIKMCKHGSPGNTDSTGSSDFLEYCGINLFAEKEVVETAVEKLGFAYTEALDNGYKRIHCQTHRSAHLAHMNDLIGPITNPLHPQLMRKRVLGVNHLLSPRVVAEAYQVLNAKGVTQLEQGLFVRGFVDLNKEAGIDEVSIFPGGTKVAELKDGKIECYELDATDFGLSTKPYFQTPPGKERKARFSLEILKMEIPGAPRELALANAALLEYLARGTALIEGYKKAEETLQSGIPLRLLQGYAKVSQGGRA